MPLQSPGLATKKTIALNRVNMPFALKTEQAPFLQHPRTRLRFDTSDVPELCKFLPRPSDSESLALHTNDHVFKGAPEAVQSLRHWKAYSICVVKHQLCLVRN